MALERWLLKGMRNVADIAMCDNQQCGIRAECYRAMAERSDYQCWQVFPLTDELRPKAGCSFFVEFVPHTRKAEKSEIF